LTRAAAEPALQRNVVAVTTDATDARFHTTTSTTISTISSTISSCSSSSSGSGGVSGGGVSSYTQLDVSTTRYIAVQ